MPYKVRTTYKQIENKDMICAIIVCEQSDNGDIHNNNIFESSINNYVDTIVVSNYLANEDGLKALETEVKRIIDKAASLIESRRFLEKKFKPFDRLIEI